MLECVANVAEGRRPPVITALVESAGSSVRDVHSDADHHRTVITLIDEVEPVVRATRSLAATAFRTLDFATHEGAHPRLGVLDVVPFVALDPSDPSIAVALRDETAAWIADEFGVPVFLYGPLDGGGRRSLPDIRRHAFGSLQPDFGPREPHPRLGATCVGARPLLVAWNLWLSGTPIGNARSVAVGVRSPAVRALAFELGDAVQVSCNVIDVEAVRLSDLFDSIVSRLPRGGTVDRAEVVGLVPHSVLQTEDPARWAELGLFLDATIEARLVR